MNELKSTIPIPGYLELSPSEVPKPPVNTRTQNLPFNELTWKDFERLCLRIARREADVAGCRLYEKKDQRGIDFFGYLKDSQSKSLALYQCKKVKKFSPSSIRTAVSTFLAGEWASLAKKFVLCVSIALDPDEILKQRSLLAEKGIDFIVWDGSDTGDITEKLKEMPDLVDDFFDRHWVKLFNGEAAAESLGNRLDGSEVVKLRNRMKILYETLFTRHDPGINLLSGKTTNYLSRYVLPDVQELKLSHEIINKLQIDREDIEDKKETFYAEDREKIRRKHPLLKFAVTGDIRIPVIHWLTQGKENIVLGVPGIGKSALLKFIALSLLNESDIDQTLAKTWGNYLPIWISFGAWTKAVADDKNINLEDFIKLWLHQNSADDLIPLFIKALRDERLLLLIDGLDEGFSEQIASIVLDRLLAFLSNSNVSVIMTSRPDGFEKIRPTGEWRVASLADLSDIQIKQLIHFWFEHVLLPQNSAVPNDTIFKQAEIETKQFLDELKTIPRISDLARIPLLCMLLIEVKRYTGGIPEHRIKVYDKMVEHLIVSHPAMRLRSAGITSHSDLIENDDLKEMLSKLALHIQEMHGGGFAPVQVCEEFFKDYLSDPNDGLGLSKNEAKKSAKSITEKVKSGLGLLVERSRNELGFFHLSLQEFLAALAITKKPFDQQVEILKKHWRDSRWQEVVLGVFGIHGVLNRDRSVIDKLIKELKQDAKTELDRLRLLPLIAEVVFGNMGLSPAASLNHANKILDEIETSSYPKLRQSLTRLAVQGLRVNNLSDTIEKKLHKWFPARSSFDRARILTDAGNWSPADDLLETFKSALYSDEDNCQLAAAKSLAKVYGNDPSIVKWLLEKAKHEVNPDVRAAVIIALIKECPNAKGLDELLEQCRNDLHPGVRLSVIEGRVITGIQNDEDLEMLWKLANWDSGLSFCRQEEIFKVIVSGFSQSKNLKERLMKVLNDRWLSGRHENAIDPELAAELLLLIFPVDDNIAKLFAELFKLDHSPMWFSGYRDVWPYFLKKYRKHPLLSQSIEIYLNKQFNKYKFHVGPDEAYAMVVIGSEEIKNKLIDYLNKDKDHIGKYWAVKALTDGWQDDEKVIKYLKKVIEKPVKESFYLAAYVKYIIKNNDRRRNWLLSVVREKEAKRVRFAVELLLNEYHDEEVLEAVLESLKTDRWLYDDHDVKRSLVKCFPNDPRVKNIAWELWDGPDNESLSSLVISYENDPAFRPLLLNAMSPAHNDVRLEVTTLIGSGITPEKHSVEILKKFMNEDDAGIRSNAVVSLAKRVGDDPELKNELIKTLQDELVAIGGNMDKRRIAAVAGLIKLGKIDLLINKSKEDREESYINLEKRRWDNDYAILLQEILQAWPELKKHYGEEIFNVLGTGESQFWSMAAPFSQAFPEFRNEIENCLKKNTGKEVDANTLEMMANFFPRSPELRSTCLASISHFDIPNQTPLTALRLLGQHFGNDEDTINSIIEIKSLHPNIESDFPSLRRLLIVFCYGWPNHPVLQEWLNKPESKWKGMPFYLVLHLCRVANEPERMLKYLKYAIEVFSKNLPRHDNEVVRAVRMWVAEGDNRMKLTNWLDQESPSLIASAIGLITSSGRIDTHIKEKLETLFEKEVTCKDRPPRVGFDISTGQLRPIPEIIYSALIQSS